MMLQTSEQDATSELHSTDLSVNNKKMNWLVYNCVLVTTAVTYLAGVTVGSRWDERAVLIL